MVWAQQLHSDGVVHLPITPHSNIPPGEIAPAPHKPRRIVLWSGERPVGMIDQPCSDELLHAQWKNAAALADAIHLEAGRQAALPHTVSLVICTRDRPVDLARCLASIPHQTRPPDEVIVVDNGSISPDVEEVCRAAGVHYVQEPRPGLDIARNTGARSAAGEIVAYTDDDVVLHPDWLMRLMAAFDSPEIMAVTGLVLPAELATQAQWHFERHWGFGRGFSRIDFGAPFFAFDRFHGAPVWDVGAGASMAFRRLVFQQIGFFDERLDVGAAGCSGDSEFWHQILSAGGICRYEPSVVAFHYHRREMPALRKQIRAYMRGHAAALLVQYERTGHFGNLRRILFDLPAMYLKRMVLRIFKGKRETDIFTWDEIAGVLSGVAFYFRSPRPRSGGAKVSKPDPSLATGHPPASVRE